MVGGWWLVVGGQWLVAGGRWPVAGDRWPVANAGYSPTRMSFWVRVFSPTWSRQK